MSNLNWLYAFIGGAIIGAGVAILFAPEKGEDMRNRIKDMLKKKTPVPTPEDNKYINEVGVFEGGGYEPKGMYRPKMDCLMKTFQGDKFCEVCHKAIEKMILYYTE